MADRRRTAGTIQCMGMILILFSVSVFTGCAAPYILHQRKDVSRDWTYLDFSRTNRPFVTRSAVGGEHMTFYRVIGFQNDRFIITLTPLTGDLFFSAAGEGVHVESLSGGAHRKKTVAVLAEEAVFSVELSAHPYGEYQLEIKKLPVNSTP